MKQIDIILLTCNRIKFLKQVIESFEERLKTKFRLIIINNNSKDGTTEYLNDKKETAEYPIILLHRKEGEELVGSRANTEGLKYIESEYFITTQDDLLVPDLSPCVIQQLIDLMERYPECGAICLRDQSMRRKPIGDEEIIFNIGACPAWFRLQRKSDFDSVGGFGIAKRWEDTEILSICNKFGKKAGFASNLWVNNIGLAIDRGYPSWYLKEKEGDKRFEWIRNEKKQFKLKQIDPITNQPVEGCAYSGAYNIRGWMRPVDLSWLYQTAKNMDSIIEIGSWKGRSTFALLSGCKGIVHAVDHFLGNEGKRDSDCKEAKTGDIYNQFLNNVGHFGNLKVYKMDSLSASKLFEDNSVDMVFIDAGHTYNEVVADIEAWAPKARKLVCGHDAPMKSVIRAVKDKLGESKINTKDGHIWTIEK